MKFTWGTGIFIFLTLFLLAAGVFIIFAFRQDVNLVHKDYYQQGVDYTEQMNVEARSGQYKGAVKTSFAEDEFIVGFYNTPGFAIDSGGVKLYRPSDSDYDLQMDLNNNADVVSFPREQLISGRYILTVYWYSEGLKYELKEAVFIQ